MKHIPYLLVFTLLSGATIGTIYAAEIEKNDALMSPKTTITLSQAVLTAEQNVIGRASSADLEKHKGQWVFDIEVIKDNKVMDVKIDPESGKVLSVTEDQTDRDDDQDKED